MEWCLKSEEGIERAVPLLYSLVGFWVFGFHPGDGRRLYAAFVERARAAGMTRPTADLARTESPTNPQEKADRAKVFATGRALSLEQAIAYALADEVKP